MVSDRKNYNMVSRFLLNHVLESFLSEADGSRKSVRSAAVKTFDSDRRRANSHASLQTAGMMTTTLQFPI